MIKILESTDKKSSIITINVTGDYSNQLLKLLNDIKKTAAVGHTFDVIVDPNANQLDNDEPRSYEIDGDGSFHILDIQTKYVDKE